MPPCRASWLVQWGFCDYHWQFLQDGVTGPADGIASLACFRLQSVCLRSSHGPSVPQCCGLRKGSGSNFKGPGWTRFWSSVDHSSCHFWTFLVPKFDPPPLKQIMNTFATWGLVLEALLVVVGLNARLLPPSWCLILSQKQWTTYSRKEARKEYIMVKIQE
jgi:hypothetical protein